MVSRQFLGFLFTGGIAGAINFLSRIFLSSYFDFSTAVVIAYLIGMASAFMMVRSLIFLDDKKPMHHSMVRFLIINIIGLAQTWGISVALELYIFPYAGMKFYSAEIAHIIGLAFPVATSFYGHKKWTFN